MMCLLTMTFCQPHLFLSASPGLPVTLPFFAFDFGNAYQHECQQIKPQDAIISHGRHNLGQGSRNLHLSKQTLLHKSRQDLLCCLFPLLVLAVFIVLHHPAHFQIFLFYLSRDLRKCHFVLGNSISLSL